MQQIIDLFKGLSRIQQAEVLKKLQIIAVENNPIVELSRFSQKMYGQNVIKRNENVGTPYAPVIMVEWDTPWGKFSATAQNGAEAAKLAAEQALEKIPADGGQFTNW